MVEINDILIFYNYNEEKIKSNNNSTSDNNIISIIKKIILSIINFEKSKFSIYYNEFVNSIINGKDEKNNFIKYLIDPKLNNDNF